MYKEKIFNLFVFIFILFFNENILRNPIGGVKSSNSRSKNKEKFEKNNSPKKKISQTNNNNNNNNDNDNDNDKFLTDISFLPDKNEEKELKINKVAEFSEKFKSLLSVKKNIDTEFSNNLKNLAFNFWITYNQYGHIFQKISDGIINYIKLTLINHQNSDEFTARLPPAIEYINFLNKSLVQIEKLISNIGNYVNDNFSYTANELNAKIESVMQQDNKNEILNNIIASIKGYNLNTLIETSQYENALAPIIQNNKDKNLLENIELMNIHTDIEYFKNKKFFGIFSVQKNLDTNENLFSLKINKNIENFNKHFNNFFISIIILSIVNKLINKKQDIANYISSSNCIETEENGLAFKNTLETIEASSEYLKIITNKLFKESKNNNALSIKNSISSLEKLLEDMLSKISFPKLKLPELNDKKWYSSLTDTTTKKIFFGIGVLGLGVVALKLGAVTKVASLASTTWQSIVDAKKAFSESSGFFSGIKNFGWSIYNNFKNNTNPTKSIIESIPYGIGTKVINVLDFEPGQKIDNKVYAGEEAKIKKIQEENNNKFEKGIFVDEKNIINNSIQTSQSTPAVNLAINNASKEDKNSYDYLIKNKFAQTNFNDLNDKNNKIKEFIKEDLKNKNEKMTQDDINKKTNEEFFNFEQKQVLMRDSMINKTIESDITSKHSFGQKAYGAYNSVFDSPLKYGLNLFGLNRPQDAIGREISSFAIEKLNDLDKMASGSYFSILTKPTSLAAGIIDKYYVQNCGIINPLKCVNDNLLGAVWNMTKNAILGNGEISRDQIKNIKSPILISFEKNIGGLILLGTSTIHDLQNLLNKDSVQNNFESNKNENKKEKENDFYEDVFDKNDLNEKKKKLNNELKNINQESKNIKKTNKSKTTDLNLMNRMRNISKKRKQRVKRKQRAK